MFCEQKYANMMISRRISKIELLVKRFSHGWQKKRIFVETVFYLFLIIGHVVKDGHGFDPKSGFFFKFLMPNGRV